MGKPEDLDFPLVRAAIRNLGAMGAVSCFTAQNLGEFWNVLTRPANRNGYGLSPAEANIRAATIEANFRLIVDNLDVYNEWRRLLVDYNVSGVQVHDARLVAAMRVHGVRQILTFNARDFARYPGIDATHPRQLAGG